MIPPGFENIRKRQVKAPKIYIRDSGILHTLLQLRTLADLQGHPKIGASWEGFAIEHVISTFEIHDAYFWATHAGAELDLVVMTGADATVLSSNTRMHLAGRARCIVPSRICSWNICG
jgi:predicted AAA+ superfamily ATPase